jgi:hypothetical protein
MSVMHPISKLRLETRVAVIRLKELPGGFGVLSMEAVLIDSFPDDQKQIFRDRILSNQANYSDKTHFTVMFEMDVARSFISGYILGDYSNLAEIHTIASNANDMQADLINMSNNEL